MQICHEEYMWSICTPIMQAHGNCEIYLLRNRYIISQIYLIPFERTCFKLREMVGLKASKLILPLAVTATASQ